MSKTTSYGCSPGFAEYSFTTTGLCESSPRFRRTESRRERQQRRFEERLAIFHALATCADAPAKASSLCSKEDLNRPESRSSGPSFPLDSYSLESHPRLLQHHPRNGFASRFDSAPFGRSGRREPSDCGHAADAIRDPTNAGESRESRAEPTTVKLRAPPSAERPLTAGGAGPPIAAEDLQWAWRLLMVGGYARPLVSDFVSAANAQAVPRSRSGERGNAGTQRCTSAAEKTGNAGERWGGLQGMGEKEAEGRDGRFAGGAGAERKSVGLRQVGGSRTWAVPPPHGNEQQQLTAAQRRQQVRRSQWLLRWLQQQQEQQQLHQHQKQQQQPSCGSSEQETHAFPLSAAELRGDGTGDLGDAGHAGDAGDAGVSARLGRLSLSSASSAERRPFRQLSPFEATSRGCAPLVERWEREQGDEARRIAAPGDADGSADADADADARRRVEDWFRGYTDANVSAGADVADASAQGTDRGDCADSVAEIAACANPRPVPRKHFPSPLGRAWSAREAGERVLLRPARGCHAHCDAAEWGGQTAGGCCEKTGPTPVPRYYHNGGSFEDGGTYAPRYNRGHGTQRSVQRSRSLQERRGGVASRHDFPGWQDGVFPKRGTSCGLPENLGGGVVTRKAGYTQAFGGGGSIFGGGGGGSIFGEMTFGDQQSSQGFDSGSQAPQKLYPGPDVKPKTPSHRHGSLSFSEWVGAKSSSSANGLRTRGRGHQVGGSAGSEADVAPAVVTFAATTDVASAAAGGATNVATPMEIIPSNHVVVTVDASDVTTAPAAPDVTAAPSVPDVTAAPDDTDVTVASTTTPTTAAADAGHVTAAPTTTDIEVAVGTTDVAAAASSDTTHAIAAFNKGSTATGASDVQTTRRDVTKDVTEDVTEDVTAVCRQLSGADCSSEACQPMCGEIVLAEPRSESALESPEACRPIFQGNISVEPRVLKSGEEQGKSCEVPEGLRHGEEQGKDHHSRCPSFSLWVSPTPRLPPPSSPLISPLFAPSTVFSNSTVFTPLTTHPSHPLASSPRPLTNTLFLALTS